MDSIDRSIDWFILSVKMQILGNAGLSYINLLNVNTLLGEPPARSACQMLPNSAWALVLLTLTLTPATIITVAAPKTLHWKWAHNIIRKW